MLVALERRGVGGDTSMRRWLPLQVQYSQNRRIQMLAIRMLLTVMFVTRKSEQQIVGVGIGRLVSCWWRIGVKQCWGQVAYCLSPVTCYPLL